jgi:hypothetical protein
VSLQGAGSRVDLAWVGLFPQSENPCESDFHIRASRPGL